MLTISQRMRILLLWFAIAGLIGPNGLFLYYYFTNPSLMDEALANPISMAFFIEALFLLVLFLGFIWQKKRSLLQVVLFLGLSMLGSLAFSCPLFFYLNSGAKPDAGG